VETVTWRFDLPDGPHEVVACWWFWSGRRSVYLDGEKIVDEQHTIDFGSVHEFRCAFYLCRLEIELHMRFTPRIRLTVAENVIQPSHNEPVIPLLRPAGSAEDVLVRAAGLQPVDQECLLRADEDSPA
jgi:hypothetical protein